MAPKTKAAEKGLLCLYKAFQITSVAASWLSEERDSIDLDAAMLGFANKDADISAVGIIDAISNQKQCKTIQI